MDPRRVFPLEMSARDENEMRLMGSWLPVTPQRPIPVRFNSMPVSPDANLAWARILGLNNAAPAVAPYRTWKNTVNMATCPASQNLQPQVNRSQENLGESLLSNRSQDWTTDTYWSHDSSSLQSKNELPIPTTNISRPSSIGEERKQCNLSLPTEYESRQNQCDGLLQNILSSLSSGVASPPSEGPKVDGSVERGKGIDLDQTPAKKPPKRRKHRAKVIREGKPKRAKKVAATKSSTFKEMQIGKRKYVRKAMKEPVVGDAENPTEKRKYEKKKSEASAAQQNEPFKETNIPNGEFLGTSCRRALYYDMKPAKVKKQGTAEAPKIQIMDNEINLNVDFITTEASLEANSMYRTNEESQISLLSKLLHGIHHPSVSTHQIHSSNNIVSVGIKLSPVQTAANRAQGEHEEVNGPPTDNDISMTEGLLRETNFQSVPSMSSHPIEGQSSKRKHHQIDITGVNNSNTESSVLVHRDDHWQFKKLASKNCSENTNKLPTIGYSGRSAMFSHAKATKVLSSSSVKAVNAIGYAFQSNTNAQRDAVNHRQNDRISKTSYDRHKDRILSRACHTYMLKHQHASASIEATLKQKENINKMKKQKGFPQASKEQSTSQEDGGEQAVDFAVESEIVSQMSNLYLSNMTSEEENKDQNALVLHKGNGTIVPYEGFELVKKRKPRPKVDLDQESERLWKLLMAKGETDDPGNMDKEKEKWWEEERRTFHGRAESFIARMHLVQGDRRFSKWKGSVVDSVIGVFLTQNVSDHLSSSAFMSLAARFPLKSTRNNTSRRDSASMMFKQPDIGKETRETIKWIKELLSSSHSDQSNLTLNEPHPAESEYLQKGLGFYAEESMSSFPLLSSTLRKEKDTTNDSKGLRQTSKMNNMAALQWERPSHETIQTVSTNCLVYEPQQYKQTNLHPPHQSQIVAEEETSYSEIAFSINPTNLARAPAARRNQRSSNKNISDPKGNIVDTEDEIRVSDKKLETGNEPQQQTPELYSTGRVTASRSKEPLTAKKGKASGREKDAVDWDNLRKEAQATNGVRERSTETMDSLDYEALRFASISEVSETIKERGMNNMLAARIKEFLDRLVQDHGAIDLEWLRDVPPEKAKDYLLSVRGLGLKSVECVRLLTLHHLAFPVDTNVGRIAVRLGWVPIQPLPESLQLHLLELYPVLETVQKYLWPRLCKLDQRTLYELHYQLITFGKVFCTKSRPNCNACPMRAECRHFASAFASARLALPGPEEKSVTTSISPLNNMGNLGMVINHMPLMQAVHNLFKRADSCIPIIEEPASPEQEEYQVTESDIEDAVSEYSDETPSINLNMEQLTKNVHNFMQGGDMSKALVVIHSNGASVPMAKLKNVSRLRTEHQVYELPDSHPLLEGMDRRETDDPSPYLFAIWSPGETSETIQQPGQECECHEPGKLCNDRTCFSCNGIREANSETVRGTLLIPCRTAMKGSFPLNGTYFQVNEVFADHKSSMDPITVPRAWIWNLPRRMVNFGSSCQSIFKGLSTGEIQECFWKGFVCVRGFEQETRAPRPLVARLHFSASKLAKEKNDKK